MAEFDKILDSYDNGKNIVVFEGAGLQGSLFKMLMAGRIDALPGAPEEALYLAEIMDIRAQVMILNIEENQGDSESYLGYVTCSKNGWGKTAIYNINQVLLEQRSTESYRSAYERWLDPSSFEGYRKLYKEVFCPLSNKQCTKASDVRKQDIFTTQYSFDPMPQAVPSSHLV